VSIDDQSSSTAGKLDNGHKLIITCRCKLYYRRKTLQNQHNMLHQNYSVANLHPVTSELAS